MIIKIKQLTMQNFKGFKDFTVNFADKITRISGKNEEGKSTIVDAVNWVLFNKLADGTKADKIRPHDTNGVEVDFVEIYVELNLEVDGKPLNIIKTQNQDWVTKRGETEKQFKGNTNQYIVNGTPKSETDFKKFFDEIISEDLFVFVSNESAFLKLKNEDRRNKLFELASNLTDSDVVTTNSKFESLSSILESKSIEDLISECNFSLNGNGKTNKGLKGEMEDIPKKIDAVNKLKVDVDVSDLELQKNSLKEQIAEVEKKEEDTEKASEVFNAFTKEIWDLNFKKSDIERTATTELSSQKTEIQKRIDVASRELLETLNKSSTVDMNIQKFKDAISRYKDDRKRLYDEYIAINNEVFDENEKICPKCHQQLPSEAIEELIANEESDRKKRKDIIEDQGNQAKASIEKYTEEVANLEKQLETLKADKIKFNAEKGKAMEELSKLPLQADLSMNQEYEALTAEINQKELSLKEMNSGADYRSQLRIKRLGLTEELAGVQKKLDSADNSRFDEEIESYKARHKEVAQLIANVEKNLLLYKDFKKAKMDMLTDEVNKHFSIVKWKLFESNIQTDGYKDICEPTYKGTLYNKGLNDGHKILVGLDIVNTLQRINGVSVPIFVDNQERLSSNNIPNLDCQIIMLKVSDEELKVEGE
jgi:DNA repair exonuclease SbcCD ATPase subunit